MPRTCHSIPLVLAVAMLTGIASAAAPTVKVDWTDPAGFSETRQTRCWRDHAPESWLAELARHVERRAGRLLGDGEQLTITFTDMRRAGDCEPGSAPRSHEIRIVRDIHPPRIVLRYTLADAGGSLLREGEVTLRDVAFLSRAPLNASDPLRHEKRLLDNWLRKEFSGTGTD